MHGWIEWMAADAVQSAVVTEFKLLPNLFPLFCMFIYSFSLKCLRERGSSSGGGLQEFLLP